MIHENETADEKSYYSDYDEETDEELEKELPDATGKKNYPLEQTEFLYDSKQGTVDCSSL